MHRNRQQASSCTTLETVERFRRDRRRPIDSVIHYFGESPAPWRRPTLTREELGMKYLRLVFSHDSTLIAGIGSNRPQRSEMVAQTKQTVLITDGPFAETREHAG